MYLALYRKYRPKTFDDVVSQPHITTTLRNQISQGKTAHAYLFTGSRGTGKTTCAKIFAMAVNCHNPIDGNPCMQCESCREIDSGDAVDIVEMDAASNRSIDDVRKLREEVAYTPVTCKYRVYIIDEVHMLTAEAFNALLKTLEEPPAHVKFILATTELHKVISTIVSRCQRFEFRRIDAADSAARLMNVAALEGIALDNDAAELIARLSDGGMRDALSILDRCIASDKHVTVDVVRGCAGVADNRHLLAFAEMIAANDVAGCIRLLSELHNGSKDIARIIDELSGHFRDLMMNKAVPGERSLLTSLPDNYAEIDRICELYSLDDILRCLSLLQQCADGIGKTKQRKTVAEMCFVKMCLGYGTATPVDAPIRITTASSAPPVVRAASVQTEEMRKLDEAVLSANNDKLSTKDRRDMERFKSMAAAMAEVGKPAEKKQEPPVVAPPASKTSEPAQEVKPAEPETTAIPLPEIDPAADAPVFEEIPLPEEPAQEIFVQREFETAPVDEIPAIFEPIKSSEEKLAEPNAAVTELAESQTVSDEQLAVAANESSDEAIDIQPEDNAEALIPSAEPVASLSPAQWEEIVAKVPFIYATWMKESRPTVNDGIIEIHTVNESFKAIVENRGYSEIEQVLREVLGKPAKALLVLEDDMEQTAEENNDAVKQLLDKARQLGIDVKIKQ